MVGCCNTPPRDGAKAWTYAEPIELDAYQSGGATLAVFRTGPYSDQGNGWGMIMAAPGKKSRLRLGCEAANIRGIACLVEAGTDIWSLKSGNREYQLYNDDCSVTHDAPPPRYQRWTREVVHQVGDLKVLWSLGNEGWLCSPSQSFYDGIVHTIRTAEKDFGFPAHPIGNVYKAGSVPTNANGQRGPLYDFVEVHGPPEAFCNMADPGVPVLWTESENESPPESNKRMLDAKDCADKSYGKKGALLWRGRIPDDQWSSLFGSLGGHSPEIGPRQDSSCLWNKYEQTYGGTAGSTVDEASLKRMQDATENVIKAIGGESWLFTNGGNNLKSDGTINDEYQRIDFFSMLDAMQDGCTIAGNPDAPNSMWEVDNLEAFVDPNPCNQSGHTEAFHNIIQGNYPNWNQVQRGNQLRNYPAVYKGKQLWTAVTPCTSATPGPTPTPPQDQTCGALGGTVCHQNGDACPAGYDPLKSSDCNPCCKPGMGPIPSPTPTPTPQPSPPGLLCSVEDTDVQEWRPILKPHGPGSSQIDITPVACGPRVVGNPSVHNCGTRCCELSEEKGNRACERKLYGDRLWYPETITLKQVYADNTSIMKVNPGAAGETTGKVTVCGAANADRRSCVAAFVRSTPPPACDLISPPPGTPGQGCVDPSNPAGARLKARSERNPGHPKRGTTRKAK
jgi:hypothetical protein